MKNAKLVMVRDTYIMKFRTVTGLAVIAVIWKKKKKSAPFAVAMARYQ